MPVLGNHDYVSDEQAQIMDALGRDTTWYATRFGPLRLIVLDTERTDDPAQTAWLQDTLATPQPRGAWTVVAMHKPAYSVGHHGSDEEVQRLGHRCSTSTTCPWSLQGTTTTTSVPSPSTA